MKERDRIIQKYFNGNENASIYYNIDEEIFKKVLKFENIISYEKPDILSMFENQIIGIEHFEFDSFKRTKKGSTLKIEENQIEKDFEKKMRKAFKHKKTIIVEEKIQSIRSLDNYFNNFKKIFLEHYKKIDSYIEHIKEDFDCRNKEIHICFFAEDVTHFGNFLIKENEEFLLLNPLYSDEIIEMLKNCLKVEYLIIGTEMMDKNKIIIIENRKETFEKFKEVRPEVDEKNFLKSDIHTTGYAQQISKEELKI